MLSYRYLQAGHVKSAVLSHPDFNCGRIVSGKRVVGIEARKTEAKATTDGLRTPAARARDRIEVTEDAAAAAAAVGFAVRVLVFHRRKWHDRTSNTQHSSFFLHSFVADACSPII